MHIVFDPHPTATRDVDTGLDRHDRVLRQRLRNGAPEPRPFMHFEPETMAGRMAERRAEATRFDRITGERVRFPTRHSYAHAFARAALRILHDRIQRALRFVRAPTHDDGARHVGAVAVDDGAKV